MHQVQRHGRWVAVGGGLLLAAVGLLSAAEQAGDKRKPVPDADAQTRAEKAIRGIFKAKYDKAQESVEDRLELAKTLLSEGKRTEDDDALRFVAIREARDLA